LKHNASLSLVQPGSSVQLDTVLADPPLGVEDGVVLMSKRSESHGSNSVKLQKLTGKNKKNGFFFQKAGFLIRARRSLSPPGATRSIRVEQKINEANQRQQQASQKPTRAVTKDNCQKH
jgi:hypothetical protein